MNESSEYRAGAWRVSVLAIIVLVGLVGIGVANQGWRSRIPTFDNLGYIDGAQQLLTHGHWPDRGILTSFGSYTPPGGTWLMLPGVLLFHDPRLYELPGSALLYVGTLAGIYLLARMYFGVPSALLAVVVYGVSSLGLSTAGSLWPRYPLPFFYVWMVYCTTRWVIRQDAHYLAAAIILWTVGMYVFLEMAPAIFILPAVWLLYRPPTRIKPLLIAAAVTGAVWFPYLRFETARRFIDVKSQVERTVIVPADYRTTWCDPHLILRPLDETSNSRQPDGSPAATTWGATTKSWQAAIGNFQYRDKTPFVAIVLMSLVLISLVLFSLSGPSLDDAATRRLQLWRRLWLPRIGVGLIVFGAFANEFIARRYLSPDGVLEASSVLIIRLFQILVIAGGIGLLARQRVSSVAATTADRAIGWVRHRAGGLAHIADRLVDSLMGIRGRNMRLIVASMVVPWVVLYLVIENAGRVDRLWWIWPLQAVVLAASVLYVPMLLRVPRVLRYAVAILIVIVVAADSHIWTAAEAWSTAGWSGADADQVKVVDYIASQLGSKRQTAIGYQEYIWRFMAEFNVMDPRYKVGADFDVLFKDLRGVTNTDRCAEGVAPPDEFRIVQTRHDWADVRAKGYVDTPAEPRFKLVQQFGPYEVLERF